MTEITIAYAPSADDYYNEYHERRAEHLTYDIIGWGKFQSVNCFSAELEQLTEIAHMARKNSEIFFHDPRIMKELCLVNISHIGHNGSIHNAYSLMTSDEIQKHCPNWTQSTHNVLSDSRRAITRTFKLLDIAWTIEHGVCVMPPFWEFTQERFLRMDDVRFMEALSCALVLIQWEDGDTTWEQAIEFYNSGQVILRYFLQCLNTLGNRLEERYREMSGYDRYKVFNINVTEKPAIMPESTRLVNQLARIE